ncbi:hypothetical protein ACWEHA_07260 [Amycolatopsis nivea]
MPTGLVELGCATIELPVEDVLISQITCGVHGPYTLPAGPGIYRLTVSGEKGTFPVRALSATRLRTKTTTDSLGTASGSAPRLGLVADRRPVRGVARLHDFLRRARSPPSP